MANRWQTIAKKYLKSMHGSRAALSKASAEYRGKKRRNPSGTNNLINLALWGGAAYVGYKYVYQPWQASRTTTPPSAGALNL